MPGTSTKREIQKSAPRSMAEQLFDAAGPDLPAAGFPERE